MKKKSPVRRTPAVKPAAAAKPVPAAAAVPPVTNATPAAVVPPVAAAPVAVVAPAPVPTAVPTVASPAFPADLVARLQDASAEVAVEAAAALGETGDVRTASALVAVLENADGYCHVVTRAAAAMALGRLDTPASVAALLAAADDAMAEVSREAVLALGGLNAVAAAGRLVAIVADDRGYYLPTVRHAAVRSLGRMKIASARAVLAAVAENPDEDASIAVAAREAVAGL